MSIIEKISKIINEGDTVGAEQLIHDDYQFLMHSSGKTLSKKAIGVFRNNNLTGHAEKTWYHADGKRLLRFEMGSYKNGQLEGKGMSLNFREDGKTLSSEVKGDFIAGKKNGDCEEKYYDWPKEYGDIPFEESKAKKIYDMPKAYAYIPYKTYNGNCINDKHNGRGFLSWYQMYPPNKQYQTRHFKRHRFIGISKNGVMTKGLRTIYSPETISTSPGGGIWTKGLTIEKQYNINK